MSVVKRITALAAVAVLSLTVSACGSGPAQDQPAITNDQAQYNPQPYENLRDGGTLTTALPEITPQFNVWHGDSTLYTRTVWNWHNPLLITFTDDGKAVFNPDYLSDVKQELVDGNTRVVYAINPKATYNDGTPIDWRSFETAWKSSNGTNPAYIPSSTDGYDRIASVTRGTDDRQAVVTFRGINLWWESLFNNLIHPKALDAGVFNQGFVDNAHPEWGAGPYTVQNFDKQNGTISFVRNPKWWGRSGKLDTRTFLTMESAASINAFKNGQIDATGVGSQDRLAQVQGMTGIDIRRSVDPSLNYLTLNGQSPVLADPAVRKAVFQAVDRQQLQAIEFQGLGFDPPLAGSMIILPFQDGYQDNFSKVLTFDPEQARQGLDAAGWAPGPDGVRVKDGTPLEFTYVNTGDDATGKALAGALAAMLKNIGVQLTIRQVPSSEFSAIVTGKRFDMFYSGASQTDPYGVAYFCQLWCSDTQFIKSGVNDPALDAEIRRINSLATPHEQYAASNAAEIKAFSTYGVMPTILRPAVVAVKQGLANYGAGQFFTPTPENIGWQK